MSIVFNNNWHTAALVMGNIDNLHPEGVPLFRRVYHTDANGERILAYPNQWCSAHSSSYDEQVRQAFQPSDVQLKSGNFCLGNEGTLVFSYKNGVRSKAKFNASTKEGVSCSGCHAIGTTGGIMMSVTHQDDFDANAMATTIIRNNINTFHAGELDLDELGSNPTCKADDFVHKIPYWSQFNPPDEYNNRQATGGESYTCISFSAIVSVPDGWGGSMRVYMPSGYNFSANTRPTNGIAQLCDFSTTGATTRLRPIRYSNNRWYYLLDAVQSGANVEPDKYTHIFVPYVWFSVNADSGFFEFEIHDITMSVRLYDTIRSGPT